MSLSPSNLNDPDALLLLYAAGEASDADRAAVERMLAADPSLGCRLDDLSQLLGGTDELLAAGDAEAAKTMTAGPAAVDRVAARAASAVRAWQLGNRPVAADDRVAAAPIQWRRLGVPAAAAAAIVVLLTGGYLVRNMGSPSLPPLPRVAAVDRSTRGADTPDAPMTTGEPDGPGVRETFALLRAVGAIGPVPEDREVPLLPPLSPAELARATHAATPSAIDPGPATPAFPPDAVASAAADGPFFDVPLDLPDAAPTSPDNDPPVHQPLP